MDEGGGMLRVKGRGGCMNGKPANFLDIAGVRDSGGGGDFLQDATHRTQAVVQDRKGWRGGEGKGGRRVITRASHTSR